ncbi:CaiB/BaiF CoA transferase family protein [Marinobacterium sediminicola]|uniref:Formyl-CoA transferase n=1 Tax=Marinobacterium sediminicola TaxID=518898 RepID=A0ABY1S1S9_9GAMM|nr:CaiB/BaiF CoA-transferase family protein [Marinobacterium sediminicola]ULG69502.1 CoA transferase [Marinobacterium sediminicola]SMR75652.1 formyl-CoA transferase [Marinobacterium sediminicola]
MTEEHSSAKEQASQPLPLEGVRVLELGSLIAGPYAASILAQFGAEVIKVEPPGTGDPLRRWRKMYKDTSLWWYSQSRNKKSLTLNLKDPDAQAVIHKLVEECDIVIENFRPGTLEKWNLGWEQLSAINPSLIMIRVSGYGQDGPYASRPGFAAIAESIGGLRYLAGYPDRPPVRAGVSIGDTLASLYGVIGAMMAMHHLKVNGGKGQYVDVALYEAVFGVMESLIPEYGMFGFVRERTGASMPGIAPSSTYRSADDRYIVIAANSDSIFKRLMNAIDRPDLAEDPELAHNDGRARRSDELDEAIEAWTSSRSLEAALKVLEDAAVPSSGINTAADIFEDPHFRARGMITEQPLPDGEQISLPGIVPKLSETPGATRWLGPQLGEHNEEILSALGYDADAIQGLKDKGAL